MGRGLFRRGLKCIKNKVIQIKNLILFYKNIILIKGYDLCEKFTIHKIHRLNIKRERLYSQTRDAVNTINVNHAYGNINTNTKIINESISILNRSRVGKTLVDEAISITCAKLHIITEERAKLVNTNKILKP